MEPNLLKLRHEICNQGCGASRQPCQAGLFTNLNTRNTEILAYRERWVKDHSFDPNTICNGICVTFLTNIGYFE